MGPFRPERLSRPPTATTCTNWMESGLTAITLLASTARTCRQRHLFPLCLREPGARAGSRAPPGAEQDTSPLFRRDIPWGARSRLMRAWSTTCSTAPRSRAPGQPRVRQPPGRHRQLRRPNAAQQSTRMKLTPSPKRSARTSSWGFTPMEIACGNGGEPCACTTSP